MEEPLEFVIARSSIGGHAWCRDCHHPDLLHPGEQHCASCPCPKLVRMTPDEWLRWQHPGSLRTV
jgi:hypothetical protein